jgi:hypothetical protein
LIYAERYGKGIGEKGREGDKIAKKTEKHKKDDMG